MQEVKRTKKRKVLKLAMVHRKERSGEVEAYLRRKYEDAILDTDEVQVEDLDLKNHLSGLKHPLLKAIYLLF